MHYDDMLIILNDVAYKDWTLRVAHDHGNAYIQWLFTADNTLQYGRKWILSTDMPKSEIVSTAFKAALTAEEHECREAFKYKGKKIFGPHFDVDLLVLFAGKRASLDLRETPEEYMNREGWKYVGSASDDV